MLLVYLMYNLGLKCRSRTLNCICLNRNMLSRFVFYGARFVIIIHSTLENQLLSQQKIYRLFRIFVLRMWRGTRRTSLAARIQQRRTSFLLSQVICMKLKVRFMPNYCTFQSIYSFGCVLFSTFDILIKVQVCIFSSQL